MKRRSAPVDTHAAEAARAVRLMADRPPTYASLLAAGTWRPIPNCPGRRVWRGRRDLAPRDLLGPGVAVRIFHADRAGDPVHVAILEDGGVISYARPDGAFVHTLNTPDGLARKLADLGIDPASVSRSAAAGR